MTRPPLDPDPLTVEPDDYPARPGITIPLVLFLEVLVVVAAVLLVSRLAG